MSESWSDTLTCPCCGSADTGVLTDEKSSPTVLNGVQVGTWKEPGRGCCRSCGCEFSFESEEVIEE
jgi:hypothetical protein